MDDDCQILAAAADGILDVARERSIDTVVVGRESLSWFENLVHRHVGHALVTRASPGLALWIVQWA